MSWWGGSQPGGQPWLASLSPPLLFSLEAVRLGPCSGLLVDWLEMLDPEVISNCPDLQQRLLFSRNKVGRVWLTVATSALNILGSRVCPQDAGPGSHLPTGSHVPSKPVIPTGRVWLLGHPAGSGVGAFWAQVFNKGDGWCRGL